MPNPKNATPKTRLLLVNIWNIWLPTPLYHSFPLVCVIAGFSMAALAPNPIGVSIALGLYIYAFKILWLRLPADKLPADD